MNNEWLLPIVFAGLIAAAIVLFGGYNWGYSEAVTEKRDQMCPLDKYRIDKRRDGTCAIYRKDLKTDHGYFERSYVWNLIGNTPNWPNAERIIKEDAMRTDPHAVVATSYFDENGNPEFRGIF